MDNSIIINAAVKLVSVIGTMLFTPVSVIGPVSSLAFWTAILDKFALSAQHQFLTFVTLLAAIATSHFCLSFQSVILFLQAGAAISFVEECYHFSLAVVPQVPCFRIERSPRGIAGAVANRPTPYSTRSRVIASNSAYIELMLPSSRRRFVPKDTKQFIKNLQASLS